MWCSVMQCGEYHPVLCSAMFLSCLQLDPDVALQIMLAEQCVIVLGV